jgi:hypothetical protein
VSRWNPGFVEDLSQHEGDVESVSANLVEAARRKLENSVVLSATKDDLRMNTLPSMAPMSPFSGGMAPISEAEGGTPAKSPIRPPRRRVRRRQEGMRLGLVLQRAQAVTLWMEKVRTRFLSH